ncbi:hypothetical protein AB0J38_42840 [Streptomyces sp. NPDC050095]|uniref:hypothetical protein n=1 Tax=unclassified Streptomyces TaxID=2593676 RepID=UPI003429EF66
MELPGRESGDPEDKHRAYILIGVVMAAGMLVGAVKQVQKGAGLMAGLMGLAFVVCLACTELSRRRQVRPAAAVFVTAMIVLGLAGALLQ